ncbi:MAG: phosphodiester glycosidase family protein [Flavonifractor plautii]
MKQWIRRGAALGLALALTVTAASASQAMGWDVHTGRAPLSQGASLGKNVFWSDTYSDLRTEYYVEYSPNASVVPTVAYGSKVTDRVTLSGMAQTLESQGKRVVSGLNGDWYVLSTGAPTGLVVTDGIVRATGYYNDTWAIGFNADGTAFIARNGLSVSVSFGGQAVKLGGGINKVRKLTDSAAVGGLTLLTDDFATTTQNTEPGVDVILSPVDDGTGTYAVKPTIGRQTQYVVEQVLESTGSIPIPEGKAVLTLNAKESEEALARLRALQPGDTVTLTVSSSDQRWSQAVQALGGVSKLVTNGQVDSGLDASRTAWPAIGIKADGTVIFYAMDGKQPGYSVGATQGQVAQRLIELGCVEAICMDGGGSTTIGVTYPDQEGMQVVNKPSDGSQRKNSTAIFLTTGLQPTGELASYYVTPSDSILLSGATVRSPLPGWTPATSPPAAAA